MVMLQRCCLARGGEWHGITSLQFHSISPSVHRPSPIPAPAPVASELQETTKQKRKPRPPSPRQIWCCCLLIKRRAGFNLTPRPEQWACGRTRNHWAAGTHRTFRSWSLCVRRFNNSKSRGENATEPHKYATHTYPAWSPCAQLTSFSSVASHFTVYA
jgi:hypothetical protein